MIKATIEAGRILTESTDLARELFNQGHYGTITRGKQVHLSLLEALYLVEKGRIEVLDGKKKAYTHDRLLKLAKKQEVDFWVRYAVYRDMRERGYVIKTAFKFGADFRVYERGVKPGEDHAKWVVFPVHEAQQHSWHSFSAKNRVAHSTKKRLLIAVVDDEEDITYYEVKWVRP